jgi:ankyrin repeat protein
MPPFLDVSLRHDSFIEGPIYLHLFFISGVFLQTPLHIAAASTNGVGCLDVLIKMGADINVQSEDGRTPLHMTAIHGRFARSETLIDHGKFGSNLLPALHHISRTCLKICHTLCREPYGRKVLCVQQDLHYNNFDSHCMLKVESN